MFMRLGSHVAALCWQSCFASNRHQATMPVGLKLEQESAALQAIKTHGVACHTSLLNVESLSVLCCPAGDPVAGAEADGARRIAGHGHARPRLHGSDLHRRAGAGLRRRAPAWLWRPRELRAFPPGRPQATSAVTNPHENGGLCDRERQSGFVYAQAAAGMFCCASQARDCGSRSKPQAVARTDLP